MGGAPSDETTGTAGIKDIKDLVFDVLPNNSKMAVGGYAKIRQRTNALIDGKPYGDPPVTTYVG
jgi:hypothetical protein